MLRYHDLYHEPPTASRAAYWNPTQAPLVIPPMANPPCYGCNPDGVVFTFCRSCFAKSASGRPLEAQRP